MKILRVAGAQPLEQSIGVASVHDTVVDGEIADHGVRQALTDLMADLVSAELVRAA